MNKHTWVENLKKSGIKVAHPGGGRFINHEGRCIVMGSPYYNSNAKVGDLVFIGEVGDSIHDRGELIRLTELVGDVGRFEYIYGNHRSKRSWLKVYGSAARTVGWFMYGANFFDHKIPDDLYFHRHD